MAKLQVCDAIDHWHFEYLLLLLLSPLAAVLNCIVLYIYWFVSIRFDLIFIFFFASTLYTVDLEVENNIHRPFIQIYKYILFLLSILIDPCVNFFHRSVYSLYDIKGNILLHLFTHKICIVFCTTTSLDEKN